MKDLEKVVEEFVYLFEKSLLVLKISDFSTNYAGHHELAPGEVLYLTVLPKHIELKNVLTIQCGVLIILPKFQNLVAVIMLDNSICMFLG